MIQPSTAKQKIALFDFAITSSSPAGSCVLQLLKHLASQYEFIVFADQFENPAPDQITWIRVPLPGRPVIARYIIFKLLAPIYYQRFLQHQSQKPDLVVATEGEFANCDICYVHFCHRAYLRQQLLKLTSLRSFVRYINHQFNAATAATAMNRASTIVVPSTGLANELTQTYGDIVKAKLTTIPNPLDVDYFSRPASYSQTENIKTAEKSRERKKSLTEPQANNQNQATLDSQGERLRHQLGLGSQDVVVAFAALGDFERKGLKLLLGAVSRLQQTTPNPLKILVIGGTTSEIDSYTRLCKERHLSDQVKFVGFQADIRPYLWLSDLFAIPSAYETFSLVAFQAAIAGLPIMATQLYGVEDFLQPGVNGWKIERDEQSIVHALTDAIARKHQLSAMGKQAHQAASQYGITMFITRWQALFKQHLSLELISGAALDAQI